MLKQIGDRLTLKSIGKMVPVLGAGFGALFDTAQMNQVLDFADIFCHKRFILEKPERVSEISGVEMALPADYASYE